jgi:hypothetical protein
VRKAVIKVTNQVNDGKRKAQGPKPAGCEGKQGCCLLKFSYKKNSISHQAKKEKREKPKPGESEGAAIIIIIFRIHCY